MRLVAATVSLITPENGWPQLSDQPGAEPWPGDGANAIASGARGRERRYSPIVVPEGVVVSM
jgi:hypothetical protein